MFESNKRLSDIAEISLLMNRWCMWADSSLPGHQTYVPAVFQTRDAFYHFIDIFATGIGSKDNPGVLRSDIPEEIGQFWKDNTELMGQLNEILHHISRGFFDVVDHIFIQLVRLKKPAGSSDCYMWYDKQLKSYSILAQKLREEKSRTPEKTMQTVRKWDILLQHITSAYTIADEFARSEKLLLSIHKLFKRVEAIHSLESITNVCENYYELKVRFEQIAAGTDILSMVLSLGKKASALVDDTFDVDEAFITDCESLRNSIASASVNHYDELIAIYQQLNNINYSLFSITRVQKVKNRASVFSKGAKGLAEIIIAAIPTYVTELYLFNKEIGDVALSIKQVLNDNAVRFLLRYLLALIIVHVIFRVADWGWWYLSTEWQFWRLRKKVRDNLPPLSKK